MLEDTGELTGTLQANGSIVLDEPPPLAPGRVSVVLKPLPTTVRLPDPPFLDDCISAPFDLPYEGPVTDVTAEKVPYRYPEMIILNNEDKNGL